MSDLTKQILVKYQYENEIVPKVFNWTVRNYYRNKPRYGVSTYITEITKHIIEWIFKHNPPGSTTKKIPIICLLDFTEQEKDKLKEIAIQQNYEHIDDLINGMVRYLLNR